METRKLLESARGILRMLKEKGYRGSYVLQGQHGIAALDNIAFHLRQWRALGPESQALYLELSVNADWGTVCYGQFRFFLACDRQLGFTITAMEALRIGRLSNTEISRSRHELGPSQHVPEMGHWRGVRQKNGFNRI